jgi:Zn-finger nucleic acid-binding protein
MSEVHMQYHGVKKTWKRPFWLRYRKHYCPQCHGILEKIEVSKIVNWKSEEAKEFDFSSFEGSMIGNVKFIWDELRCPACNVNFKIEEIFQLEKETKRSGKLHD